MYSGALPFAELQRRTETDVLELPGHFHCGAASIDLGGSPGLGGVQAQKSPPDPPIRGAFWGPTGGSPVARGAGFGSEKGRLPARLDGLYHHRLRHGMTTAVLSRHFRAELRVALVHAEHRGVDSTSLVWV